MASCARTGCGGRAQWRPILLVRAPGAEAYPARGALDLVVCDQHRSDDPADWVCDEGWEQIVANFAQYGFATPDRGLTTIEFVAWEDPS